MLSCEARDARKVDGGEVQLGTCQNKPSRAGVLQGYPRPAVESITGSFHLVCAFPSFAWRNRMTRPCTAEPQLGQASSGRHLIFSQGPVFDGLILA